MVCIRSGAIHSVLRTAAHKNRIQLYLYSKPALRVFHQPCNQHAATHATARIKIMRTLILLVRFAAVVEVQLALYSAPVVHDEMIDIV
jgi:hypothetical protein